MSTLINNSQIYTATELAIPVSGIMDISRADSFGIEAVYTDTTPAAVTFASTAVNTGTDRITATAHGLATGVVGQFTTTVTLPTGISGSTNYYVIVVDVNTFKIATSLANAVAGTAVDITGQGSGNDTFTPTALAGNILKLQSSVDGSNFVDIPNATSTIAAAGNTQIYLASPGYRYVKYVYTPSAGAINLTLTVCIRDASIHHN